jgi:hypothetical protein
MRIEDIGSSRVEKSGAHGAGRGDESIIREIARFVASQHKKWFHCMKTAPPPGGILPP